MLPEFSKQFFQLTLISTVYTYVQNRYTQDKQTSILPIRVILLMIEYLLALIHDKVLQLLFNPSFIYVNKLDNYLCKHIDSIRYICPVVDRTPDELFQAYGDLLSLAFISKNSKSSELNSNFDTVRNVDEQKKLKFIQQFSQFLTNTLIAIEIYSKFVKNEVHDHINASRTLWKKLNMADGRSLEEVDLLSEKLLVIGRRMTGNYRHLIYLLRYQWKRCRSILFSFIRFQNRFRSLIWHTIRKSKMNRSHNNLDNGTQHGSVTSRERIQNIFDMMRACATKHPWMRWKKSRADPSTQLKFQNSTKNVRPMFFLSSNNTSDCSESDDNVRDSFYNEDELSDISSSLSSTPEQSFDVNEILQQNETNNHDKQSISVFDLSPVFASGSAI